MIGPGRDAAIYVMMAPLVIASRDLSGQGISAPWRPVAFTCIRPDTGAKRGTAPIRKDTARCFGRDCWCQGNLHPMGNYFFLPGQKLQLGVLAFHH